MDIYCGVCNSDIGLQTNEEYDKMKADLEKLQAENEQLKKELKTWEDMAESHAKAMVILERDREGPRKALWDLVDDLYTPYRLGLSEKPSTEWSALNRAKIALKEIGGER